MTAPFADQVAEYLAYCSEHARLLNPDYHPTADGAVKMVFHRGTDQAGQIRAAFRAAIAPADPPRIRRAGLPVDALIGTDGDAG
jgi:hypothetical protein